MYFNTEAGSVMFDIILIRQYKQQPYQRTEMVVSNKNATIPTQQGSPHTEKSITTMKGYNTDEGMKRINMSQHFYYHISKQQDHHLHNHSKDQPVTQLWSWTK